MQNSFSRPLIVVLVESVQQLLMLFQVLLLQSEGSLESECVLLLFEKLN